MRSGVGRHLIAELSNCDAAILNDLAAVKDGLCEAARRARAAIVATTFHQFNPIGISGVVMFRASHLSIHTWPEYQYAAVDVLCCGDEFQADLAMNYLVERFCSGHVCVVEVRRGAFLTLATAPDAERATYAR